MGNKKQRIVVNTSPWIALTGVIISGIAFVLIYLWGEETNLEEVTFPTSPATPAPSTISTPSPSTSEDEDNPLVPPSVED